MEQIKNNIFKRFHAIDDRKYILLHNLGLLNRYQNEQSLIDTDISENRFAYNEYERQEKEQNDLEKQLEITSLALRCLEDMEYLIIDVGIVIDMFQLLDDTEIDNLFSDKFVTFIHGISNLETLFMSKSQEIQELKNKVKLFGKTLQTVLNFEIVME